MYVINQRASRSVSWVVCDCDWGEVKAIRVENIKKRSVQTIVYHSHAAGLLPTFLPKGFGLLQASTFEPQTRMYTQIYTHTQQLKALLSRTGLVPGESLLSVGLNSEGGPPICLQLAPYCTSLYVLICRPTRHPIHTSHTLSLNVSLPMCTFTAMFYTHTEFMFYTHTEFIRFRAKHTVCCKKHSLLSLQKKWFSSSFFVSSWNI